MATYQLVGSQDPAGRIDRVEVESPTEENPEGKVLLLNGEPQELSQEQYSKLSRYVKLEPVTAEEAPTPNLVDQPGVEIESLSTDVPPDPGTEPAIEDMDRDQLRAEARRVGADAPGNASKDDLKKAIQAKRGEA